MSNENNICSENFNQENFNNGCMMSYKRELNTRNLRTQRKKLVLLVGNI